MSHPARQHTVRNSIPQAQRDSMRDGVGNIWGLSAPSGAPTERCKRGCTVGAAKPVCDGAAARRRRSTQGQVWTGAPRPPGITSGALRASAVARTSAFPSASASTSRTPSCTQHRRCPSPCSGARVQRATADVHAAADVHVVAEGATGNAFGSAESDPNGATCGFDSGEREGSDTGNEGDVAKLRPDCDPQAVKDASAIAHAQHCVARAANAHA
eukprot:364915-Chlamydomonas_euryale.AAC.17